MSWGRGFVQAALTGKRLERLVEFLQGRLFGLCISAAHFLRSMAWPSSIASLLTLA